jgi:hypothetical protein
MEWESISYNTVTLKYLVLLPYIRILVPRGAGARDYTVISCDYSPLRYLVWHCPFKVLILFPQVCGLVPHRGGGGGGGDHIVHFKYLWYCTFRMILLLVGCGTVPLKYLILFSHERSLVRHGEGARDSTVISCDSGPLRNLVFPSCGTVPLKYLLLFPHPVCGLALMGGKRNTTL